MMGLISKLLAFWRADGFQRHETLRTIRSAVLGHLLYRRRFLYFGRGARLLRPAQIVGSRRIVIGDRCRIEPDCILYAISEYAGVQHAGHITLGKNVYVNRRFNASSAADITIEDHVTIATNVFMANYGHGYRDIDTPINNQRLDVHGDILIGEGSWLGSNVCVLGRVHIGKHSVIGANSVVTTDIPAYCVAVGSPARVVRRYDAETQEWTRVYTK